MPTLTPSAAALSRLLRDAAFRLKLVRGVRFPCPSGLVSCSLLKSERMSLVYRCEIEDGHPLAEWLLLECEGPWRVVATAFATGRRTFIAFARPADAVTFRLLQAGEP